LRKQLEQFIIASKCLSLAILLRRTVMAKITILSDILCNQIAAGEVVERPAAVVKELVENSLDAGSRKITLNLAQGGRKEIRVVDDGSGMSPDDALLALERHATSKIRAIEDLQAIRSLGFRGEALPSIAAVSRFEMVTREPGALSGITIRLEGGILKYVRETGCPTGTTVTVHDLFYNIPARRKFLRSVDNELSHISDQILRLSLACPEVHFRVIHHDRQLYDFPQVKDRSERAGQVFGAGIVSKLRPFLVETQQVRIHGLMSAPDVQRPGAGHLFAYVNGRAVWDRMLNRAILSAYETVIARGKFPVVVLFVEIPPALVDVNVHPTKREIRFRNPGEIMDAVRATLRQTLEGSVMPGTVSDLGSLSPVQRGPPLPGSQFIRETQIPIGGGFGPLPARTPNVASLETGAVQGAVSDRLAPAAAAEREESLPSQPGSNLVPVAQSFFSRLSYLGQLAESYLLLEAEDGLIIIDQHAAHERILYDGLSSGSSREPAQRLVRSAVIELLPREAAKLRRWISPLQNLGFEVEPFGGDAFVVHSVPAILGDCSPEALLRDLLEGASEDEQTPQWSLLCELAKTAACHRAIRANQRLLGHEVRHLLETLDRTRIAATCPHGRPLWLKLTHDEIARLFHRT
jgi:DNA mismatch repair protein MutL